ncbi:hypothetical protein [uncultured Oceanisphaera sp.]|uniref:hypothetical protein n=1 Tax=uncultured Oceanisphaera sp. TaxID=353858 RepID=UPI00262C2F01|nr:hypothetical protein [uncultured Oceanisphaera sp.]
MRIFLSILGLAIFLASVIFGHCLLIEKYVSGAEFVALVIAFAIIGLILAFSSEVQEFSVAGNIVKLKEVKKDAEKSIAELKDARTETFRFLLSLSKRFPGGWASEGPKDDRIDDFLDLYNQIVIFNCEKELAGDILAVIDQILPSQVRRVCSFSDDIGTKYRGNFTLPEPSTLLLEALDDESVSNVSKRGVANGDIAKIKELIVAAVDEYKRLYELKNEITKKM